MPYLVNPTPPPTAERAQVMLEDTATLLEGLAVLQDSITTTLSHPQDTHSARVPERDVRDTLNRIHRMTNQAERELSDGRPMDALETLQAIYATLGHQLSVQVRAGFRINHAVAVKVYDRRRPGKLCGYLDPSQGVYQWGGDLTRTAYWTLKVIPLGLDEWSQVKDAVDWIEFVATDRGHAYRVSIHAAKQHGCEYNSPAGRRFGLPLGCFTVLDEAGQVVREPEARYA